MANELRFADRDPARQAGPTNEPSLVLLPGMDGTGDLFGPLIEALGSEFATIVVRYPDDALGYAEHEAIAQAALPADRPFVVLGESYSGPVAISLAATSPPGLCGYILSTSFVDCPRPILRLLRPVLGLGSLNLIPAWIAEHFTIGRFGTSDLREAQQRVLRSVSAKTLVTRLRSVADVDVCEKLKSVSIPGLYLRATEDRLVPAQAARLFERLASKGRVVDVEGPHFLLQANPQSAASEIRTFMAEATLAACRVTGSTL